jgi:hypothetical protein
MVAGLSSAGFEGEGIREGRQQGSSSLAENVAFTGRLDYVGVPGLLLGGSVFTGNSGQDATVADRTFAARVTLFDVHAQYENRGAQLRALYAHTSVGDAARVNLSNGLEGDESVGSSQYGFYVEGAYDFMTLWPHGSWVVAPFVRYERLNTQDEVPFGYDRDPANDRTAVTAGVSVKPLAGVVLKADYQWLTNEARTGTNQFNVAVGFLF